MVRGGYEEGSAGRRWLQDTFGGKDHTHRSEYATRLYLDLRVRAEADGWLDKLRYLLYEDGIVASDTAAYRDLRGILLQSPSDKGKSRHPHFRALQLAEGTQVR